MSEANYTSIGARLRECRVARGLTMHLVAKQAGINQASLSDYEVGRRLPTPQEVNALAIVLRCSPCWLVGTPKEWHPRREVAAQELMAWAQTHANISKASGRRADEERR